MNFIATLLIPLIAISGTFSLDFALDPRFEYEWPGTCLEGHLQSPIAIPNCGRTYLSQLNLEFKNMNVPIKEITVTNAARQIVFDWNRKEVERSVIVRAPADKVAPFKPNTEYILQNVHVHHGRNNQTGTMHSIGGSFYAMEMHLLFVLRQFDGNVSSAFVALGNTLEIVVLWRVSNVRNRAWSQLNDLMNSVQLKESEKITGNVSFRFSEFIPSVSTFTLYHGSIPSARCLEVITWIIFDYIMEFDTADLAMRKFTYISDGKEISLARNTRSIQSQYGRPIFQAWFQRVLQYEQKPKTAIADKTPHVGHY